MDNAYNACLTQTSMNLDAKALQFGSNKVRGHYLFIGNFRKLMEMLTPGRHLCLFLFELSNQVHVTYPSNTCFII